MKGEMKEFSDAKDRQQATRNWERHYVCAQNYVIHKEQKYISHSFEAEAFQDQGACGYRGLMGAEPPKVSSIVPSYEGGRGIS